MTGSSRDLTRPGTGLSRNGSDPEPIEPGTGAAPDRMSPGQAGRDDTGAWQVAPCPPTGHQKETGRASAENRQRTGRPGLPGRGSGQGDRARAPIMNRILCETGIEMYGEQLSLADGAMAAPAPFSFPRRRPGRDGPDRVPCEGGYRFENRGGDKLCAESRAVTTKAWTTGQ